MKSHELIYDIEQVRRFITMFVLEGENQPYMSFLQSRRKYKPTASKSLVIHRKVHEKADVELCVREIMSYQVPLGCYIEADGSTVTDDSMVIYWLLNPRDKLTAYHDYKCYMDDELCKSIRNGTTPTLPTKKHTSLLHSTMYSKKWLEFDIDTKDPEILRRIAHHLRGTEDAHACTIETHGGYHVVYDRHALDLSEIHKSLIRTSEFKYKEATRDGSGTMVTKSYVDLRTDPSPPVPGTLQGGFRVRFLSTLLPNV